MGDVAYVSEIQIRREKGPLRTARLPAEPEPVWFGVHGAVAAHYRVDPEKAGRAHATTLDYVVAAAGG